MTDKPIWFTPERPTSIAEWVLFYIERAIWIQFKAHVEQSGTDPRVQKAATSLQSQEGIENLLQAKDSKNQAVFLQKEGRTVAFREEILPYWQKLCSQIFDAASSEGTHQLRQLQEQFSERAKQEILKPSKQTS